MQHFANGKQVFGSETGRSNVIHVHRRCIEWFVIPQVIWLNFEVNFSLIKRFCSVYISDSFRCCLTKNVYYYLVSAVLP